MNSTIGRFYRNIIYDEVIRRDEKQADQNEEHNLTYNHVKYDIVCSGRLKGTTKTSKKEKKKFWRNTSKNSYIKSYARKRDVNTEVTKCFSTSQYYRVEFELPKTTLTSDNIASAITPQARIWGGWGRYRQSPPPKARSKVYIKKKKNASLCSAMLSPI